MGLLGRLFDRTVVATCNRSVKRGSTQQIHNLAIAVALISFRKVFDNACHTLLDMELQRGFGKSCLLLIWLRKYLHDRRQFKVVNGVKLYLLAAYGIPQGSANLLYGQSRNMLQYLSGALISPFWTFMN